MGNTLQYLDYEGLKYYDRKLKEQLKNLIPEDGKDGQDGQDGQTPEFKIENDILYYRYIGEGEEKWVDLGNVKGADGSIGADGTSVTIESTEDVKDDADNVIGIKINFSDGKEIIINHGKDGADGEDGDVLNMQLGEEIKTNVACGALGIGQTLTKDMTLAQIVKLLTTKVYEPSTKKGPSATLNMTYKNVTNQDTTVEVGTTITPVLTPRFNDGIFNSYASGATSPNDSNAGCPVTNYTISRGNTEIASGTTLEAFTDSYEIKEETVKYNTTISYGDSTVSPTNSNGVAVSTVKYGGSSATAASKSIYGKYQYYAGFGNTEPTAEEIRTALNGKSNWLNPSVQVYVENTTTKKTIFAIPSTYKLTEAYSCNTNDNVTSQFVPTAIKINDAGGNAVDYTMYVQTYGQTGNFKIRFTYAKK